MVFQADLIGKCLESIGNSIDCFVDLVLKIDNK